MSASAPLWGPAVVYDGMIDALYKDGFYYFASSGQGPVDPETPFFVWVMSAPHSVVSQLVVVPSTGLFYTRSRDPQEGWGGWLALFNEEQVTDAVVEFGVSGSLYWNPEGPYSTISLEDYDTGAQWYGPTYEVETAGSPFLIAVETIGEVEGRYNLSLDNGTPGQIVSVTFSDKTNKSDRVFLTDYYSAGMWRAKTGQYVRELEIMFGGWVILSWTERDGWVILDFEDIDLVYYDSNWNAGHYDQDFLPYNGVQAWLDGTFDLDNVPGYWPLRDRGVNSGVTRNLGFLDANQSMLSGGSVLTTNIPSPVNNGDAAVCLQSGTLSVPYHSEFYNGKGQNFTFGMMVELTTHDSYLEAFRYVGEDVQFYLAVDSVGVYAALVNEDDGAYIEVRSDDMYFAAGARLSVMVVYTSYALLTLFVNGKMYESTTTEGTYLESAGYGTGPNVGVDGQGNGPANNGTIFVGDGVVAVEDAELIDVSTNGQVRFYKNGDGDYNVYFFSAAYGDSYFIRSIDEDQPFTFVVRDGDGEIVASPGATYLINDENADSDNNDYFYFDILATQGMSYVIQGNNSIFVSDVFHSNWTVNDQSAQQLASMTGVNNDSAEEVVVRAHDFKWWLNDLLDIDNVQSYWPMRDVRYDDVMRDHGYLRNNLRFNGPGYEPRVPGVVDDGYGGVRFSGATAKALYNDNYYNGKGIGLFTFFIAVKLTENDDYVDAYLWSGDNVLFYLSVYEGDSVYAEILNTDGSAFAELNMDDVNLRIGAELFIAVSFSPWDFSLSVNGRIISTSDFTGGPRGDIGLGTEATIVVDSSAPNPDNIGTINPVAGMALPADASQKFAVDPGTHVFSFIKQSDETYQVYSEAVLHGTVAVDEEFTFIIRDDDDNIAKDIGATYVIPTGDAATGDSWSVTLTAFYGYSYTISGGVDSPVVSHIGHFGESIDWDEIRLLTAAAGVGNERAFGIDYVEQELTIGDVVLDIREGLIYDWWSVGP